MAGAADNQGASPSRRWPSRRVWLLLILLAGYGASLIANWPGHYSYDSLWQLAQGRSGVYNTWHPPVMAWLLGLAARLGDHGAPFVVLDAALFFGGLAGFCALDPRPRLVALPIAALLMASPLVLIYQGAVWKDVLFANAAMAGFASLAWAGRLWPRRGPRHAMLVLALALFALAGLSRQNGLIAPVFAIVGLVAMRWRDGAVRREAIAYAAAGVAAMAMLIGLATAALDAHGDGAPEISNQIKRLQVFDLAGMVRRDPGLPLAVLHRKAPGVERFVRDAAAPHWRAASADYLVGLPGADEYLMPRGDGAGPQWRALIRSRPDLYLRTRASVFLTTLGANASLCPMVFVGVDDQAPELLRAAGMTGRDDRRDKWEHDYAFATLDTPVFSHLAYVTLLVVMLALAASDLARGDRRPELVVVLAMGAAALVYAASFLVVSYACDYRYLYFLDVAAMAALLRQAASRPGAR